MSLDHVRVPFIIEPFNGRPNLDPCLRYLQRTALLTASQLTAVMAWVDLSKSAVVQFSPIPGSAANFSYSDETGPEPSAEYRAPEGY
ncbi:MAG: hypothetical protein ACJ75Z_12205 [Solirubrobacterales bacterium]